VDRANAALGRNQPSPDPGSGIDAVNLPGPAMEFSDSEMDDMIDFLDLDPRSAAVTVARQCLEQGYASLTPRQKAVYDAYLKNAGETPPDAGNPPGADPTHRPEGPDTRP